MNIFSEYQKSLKQASNGVLLSLLSEHPRTSVEDLRDLLGEYPDLGEITLAELTESCRLDAALARPVTGRSNPRIESDSSTSKAPFKREKRERGTTAHVSASSGQGDDLPAWNTRSDEGRESIDRAVLGVLRGDEPMGAEAIRSMVGGTANQIRTSLNRLIEAGEVSFQGRARGTRYTRE